MGYFFLNGFKVGYTPGLFKRTMGWKPSKVGGVFGVLLCATGGPYQFAPVWHFFFLGLGNEFQLSKKHIHAVYAIKCKGLKKKIMSYE